MSTRALINPAKKFGPSTELPTTCGVERNFANVLILSIGFMLLFTGFNTLQNYVTSLLPGNLGNESLGVLYAAVAMSLLVCPYVVSRLKHRKTMVLGGVLFVVYMVTLVKVYRPVVLVASVVIGFGAAILWVAQGSYLMACSPDGAKGRNAGIFWGIFQLCNVVGNLASYFVLQYLSHTWLFVILAICGALGVVVLCLLKPPYAYQDVERQPELRSVVEAPVPVNELVADMWFWIRQKPVLALLPMCFFTGFELAFWTGEFTQLMPADDIGLVLTAVGVTEVIGGVTVGPLSDLLGRKVIASAGACAYGAALVGTYFMFRESAGGWVKFVAAAGFGFGDCCFNTQVYAMLGTLFPAKSVAAFTIFQLAQNVGSMVGFLYSPLLPIHGMHGSAVQLWVQGGAVSVSVLAFWLVNDHHPLRRYP